MREMRLLCNLQQLPHFLAMRTSDFSVVRERLLEACNLLAPRWRGSRSIGLGPRQTIDVDYSGLRALDINQLAQIADKLGVSIDWLLGRTDDPQSRTSPSRCRGNESSARLVRAFLSTCLEQIRKLFG